MSTTIIQGTYHAGRVELDSPVDWPEGRRVSVLSEPATFGMREEDWPKTPEELARLVALIDSFESVEFTAEDEAEIAAARAVVRQKDLEAVRQKMGLTP